MKAINQIRIPQITQQQRLQKGMASILGVQTDTQLTGDEDRFLMLSRGNLKVETEGEITAALDMVLQTKYHATKMLQTESDTKCRQCKQQNTSYQHAQYWQKNSSERHDTV
jgi:hypothetical protein